jgi:hypothetical protein
LTLSTKRPDGSSVAQQAELAPSQSITSNDASDFRYLPS